MSNPNSPSNLERRSAQAILATYMQMTRYGELARHLQKVRERSLEHRMRQTADLEEASRLQRQLEAQQGQGMALDTAMERLHSRAPELASFAEAGLTYDDFKVLGLENVVKEEDVKAANERTAERRKQQAEAAPKPAETKPEPPATPQARPAAPAATSASPAPKTTKPAHHMPTLNVDIPERPTAEDNTEEIGRIVPPEAAVAVAQAAADAVRAATEAIPPAAPPETGAPGAELDLADTQPDLAPVAPAPGPESSEPAEPTEPTESDE